MAQDNSFKILVRMPGTLSDMIEALPLFKLIRDHYPEAHITALIKKGYEGIFREQELDEVICFRKKPRFAPVLDNGKDLIFHIQRQKYDVGIILPDSFSSTYIFYLGMVKRRIGFSQPFRCFMLTDRVEGGSYLDLLKPLGIEPPEEMIRPMLYAVREKHQQLHIGIDFSLDSEMLTKAWYKDIVSFIADEIPYVRISLIGQRQDGRVIEEITRVKKGAIFNCSKRVSLTAQIDRIKSFDVFISPSKDYLSVAEGVGTPFVDLSGLVENHQLLAEDFFSHIRMAILQPLKDRSNMTSFNDFESITVGTDHQKSFSAGKKVGVIILAGGMGRRLGLSLPKGLLKVGDKTLYDILLEKTKGAEKVGILTSPVTLTETKKYCSGKEIDLFHKKVYPTEEGYGVSPEGNGALFDALVYSKHWDEWKDLDVISVVAVDNPLADPLDKELIDSICELSVIGVKRDKTEAKLGVLCEKGNTLGVREYFTLGKNGMEGLGYSGSFAAKPSFFEKVAEKPLPFYRVEKKDQVFYERLVIDGFRFADSFAVVEKNRGDCFYPIKEKRDLFGVNKILDLEGVKK